ncbi:MAG: PucR family transcriptional regulator ligand-binding domain-containing protein [Actinobacteria bacterium]|nr:PucR family transcriptional regulator ligand-binding domain-containing protein [Actinomycetota bacterium]MCL5446134.1 PucR family transcriptional regulator ligand-binding domain-containing protein [Actinomycetota bacterium]
MTTGLHSYQGGKVTVADVLGLEEIQAGRPKVMAGLSNLDKPVRWVHVSEVPDIGKLLKGGELILTTGIAFPEHDAGLAQCIDDLADAGASGLVVELIRRYAEMPRELAVAAVRRGLPLIALEREVPFVTITEAVHAMILDAQLADLRIEEKVHRTFHTLATSASPADVVQKMSALTHCPVIFESLAHWPLAVARNGVPLEELLSGWEERSWRLGDQHPGWLARPVEVRGQVCGRVVLLLEHPPTTLHHTVLAGGADALAVVWLVQGPAPTLERAARRGLISDLAADRCRSLDEFYVRARSLGADLRHHPLVVLCIRSQFPFCQEEPVERALERTGTTGLVGRLSDDLLQVLIALPGRHDDRQHLANIATEIRNGHSTMLGAGFGAAYLPPSPVPADLAQAMRQASEVALAVLGNNTPNGAAVATVDDIDLRGLLRLLQDDPRLQRFIDRRLRPLWEHDQRYGTSLMDILRSYLECGGNKSLAATRSHYSRAAFYHSLGRVAAVLDCDLEDPETRVALHLAVMATLPVSSNGRNAGIKTAGLPGSVPVD